MTPRISQGLRAGVAAALVLLGGCDSDGGTPTLGGGLGTEDGASSGGDQFTITSETCHTQHRDPHGFGLEIDVEGLTAARDVEPTDENGDGLTLYLFWDVTGGPDGGGGRFSQGDVSRDGTGESFVSASDGETLRLVRAEIERERLDDDTIPSFEATVDSEAAEVECTRRVL